MCPLCSSEARRSIVGPLLEVTCDRCGSYMITGAALDQLDEARVKQELRILLEEARAGSAGTLLVGVALVEKAKRRL